MEVILASGSPRRTLLLAAAGIEHRVVVPAVDESLRPDETPAAYVLRLSGEKAAAVPARPRDVVVAADTTVVHEGSVIGKPVDADDAVAILRRLQGTVHSVLTGWTVRSGPRERFGIEESQVRFRERTDQELAGYVARTEPFDKAGAYALQADDGWLVADVTGSRSNVMGLPIGEVVSALEDLGVRRSAPQRG